MIETTETTETMPAADVVLIAYVHNRPGVLAKIAGMFYRRGFNIRTLTVAPTHEAEVSKMVVRVGGPRPDLDRLVPLVGNLVDVLGVELTDLDPAGARELCLVRVAAADQAAREAVRAAGAPFQPIRLDADENSVLLEVVGSPASIAQLLQTLAPFAVLDVSRTGATTLPGSGFALARPVDEKIATATRKR